MKELTVNEMIDLDAIDEHCNNMIRAIETTESHYDANCVGSDEPYHMRHFAKMSKVAIEGVREYMHEFVLDGREDGRWARTKSHHDEDHKYVLRELVENITPDRS